MKKILPKTTSESGITTVAAPATSETDGNSSRKCNQHKPSTLSSPSSNEDVEAILSVAQTFLTALRTKSRDGFERCCFPAGGMSLCGPALVPLRFMSINSYINCVTSISDDLDERIWDPEIRISGNGNLATVWAPFRATVNGAMDHEGIELFVMHKLDGKWKISALADSWWRPSSPSSSSSASSFPSSYSSFLSSSTIVSSEVGVGE